MTPVRHELRRFNLLLDAYGLATEVTVLAIRVAQAAEKPVWRAFRCCRTGLLELAKEGK